jgi:MFS family permease
MSIKETSQIFWERVRLNASYITTGGSWAAQLPDRVQSNLRWFYLDGVFSNGQEAINVTYLTLFVLALGASKAQIGLMTSLASLSAVFLLLPGAILAERLGLRKWLVVISGGGFTRLAILGMALLPFFLHGEAAIFAAIGLKMVMDGFSNFGLPAWTSITGEIVPIAWRGRFFGNRNMVVGIVSMVVTLIAGQIITVIHPALAGYQTVYGMAFLFGCVATFSYSHIHENKVPPDTNAMKAYSMGSLVKTMRGDPNFLAFCVSQVVWNFSLNIAGPFFSVFQVEVLKATPAIVGALSIVASLASLPAQRFFGHLNDQMGSKKVTLITGLVIPIMPLLWIFATSAWHIVPIQIFSGILWAGYGLASFNFLLSISTHETRARYSALFQIAVMISAAAGAAVGGLIVQHWGYTAIFILSGAGRLVGMLIFWKRVHAVEVPV